jgi:membrane protein implicated in regulation of membrane protease activity
MDIYQILIIVGIILILVDIFFASDFPTIAAIIIFAFVIVMQIPVHFMYRILFGILISGALVLVHYFIWKRVVLAFVNRFVAPTKMKDSIEGLVGKKGVWKTVEGKQFVQIADELHPFVSDQAFTEGGTVIVKKIKDGILIV